MSDPDYLNQWVLFKAQHRLHDEERQRGIYEYAQTYATFLQVINATPTIHELQVGGGLAPRPLRAGLIRGSSFFFFLGQAIRYNIIAEMMQAAHIRQLKEMAKVRTD